MFTPFSTGYYIGSAFVEPVTDSTIPRLSSNQYRVIETEIYAQSNNHPLIRLEENTGHFPIEDGRNLQANTLEMPIRLLPDDFIAEVKSILVAKPQSGIHSMLHSSDKF